MNVIKDLDQRCPTVFFHSPQLWRMNVAIRHIAIHIFKIVTLYLLTGLFPTKLIKFIESKLPQPITTQVANIEITQVITKSKSETNTDDFVKNNKNICFQKKYHLPHLNSHSPHVASGEWVGQCCFKSTSLKFCLVHSRCFAVFCRISI